VKGKFLKKAYIVHPHPSQCGRCVLQLVSEKAFTISLKNLGGDPWTHKWIMKFQSLVRKLFYLENRNESAFEGNGSRYLEGSHWWISFLEEQVKVCSSKGRKEE
jgi:hypothetical protein